MKKNFTLETLKAFLLDSHAVVINFSGVAECNISAVIDNPIIEMLDGMTCIRNNEDETDSNYIQFDMQDYEYNEHNSNDTKIKFNAKSNVMKSLSISKVVYHE